MAFLNLIINAIEAMEEEKGILTVSTHVAGKSCYVEIRDNGLGISPENLNRLFEPYFTSKANGLGLGLASTLTILQSHRATVRGLGLRRLNSSAELQDTPAVRSMINKVSYLVKCEG